MPEQPALDARTLNFSAGGVLFISTEPMEKGADVQITLAIPEEPEGVSFPARIRRVRTLSDRVHEIAAEFAAGDAGAQRALLEFIEQRAGSWLHDPGPQISA
jgi:Tfp pilus assembly protein PilZ